MTIGRADEGLPLAQSAVEILSRTLPRDAKRHASAQSVLGFCLAELGRREEAIPLLREGLATLERTEGSDARMTRSARRRLEAIAPSPERS